MIDAVTLERRIVAQDVLVPAVKAALGLPASITRKI
jgi:hypothetical protein